MGIEERSNASQVTKSAKYYFHPVFAKVALEKGCPFGSRASRKMRINIPEWRIKDFLVEGPASH
jgi:bifunctional pyridoxal-dependent enzyme with beta-cystathionase and maltose regulon repressor activities